MTPPPPSALFRRRSPSARRSSANAITRTFSDVWTVVTMEASGKAKLRHNCPMQRITASRGSAARTCDVSGELRESSVASVNTASGRPSQKGGCAVRSATGQRWGGDESLLGASILFVTKCDRSDAIALGSSSASCVRCRIHPVFGAVHSSAALSGRRRLPMMAPGGEQGGNPH